MNKMTLILLGLVTTIFAHPVSYNIDLVLSYDETTKMAKIECSSNSKNKCGLYSARLVDENWNEIADKRFPFLKDFVEIQSNVKPSKLEFYLIQTPEHKYIKIF